MTMQNYLNDPRHLENGSVIPSQSYADQPYTLVLPDGSWLCTLTTVAGHEGDAGQHILALRSEDKGKSWSEPIRLEPAGGPESSWVVPLHVPHIGGPLGRIYVFYVYNRDNVREAPCSLGTTSRVDTLGYYVFRYSDDGGLTWSTQRHDVPVREFAVDKANPTGGRLRYFWGVAKPVLAGNRVLIALHKVGDFGEGFLCQTEGCFIASDNILTESDVSQLRWETLPDGEIGLRAPESPISEEHSIVALSDGSLFCVWRTTMGYAAHAYSRDNGQTWTASEPMRDATGRVMKHPRAANFVWKCANGRYLYWFHHHGLRNYFGRNPAWLCAGQEVDSPRGKVLEWSQPEVALYDDDLEKGISYPDFFEDNGRFYVNETQKTIARVHELSPVLLEALWSQGNNQVISRDALKLEISDCGSFEIPSLPMLHSTRGGFSLEMRVRFAELSAWQILFDSRDESGCGLVLQLTDRDTLRFWMCGRLGSTHRGGLAETSWECDRGLLRPHEWHHFAVIVDGGPKIISWVVDGIHSNGGEDRAFGWGRFHPHLENVNGAAQAHIGLDPTWQGKIGFCRFYSRALLVSEAIAHGQRFPHEI